MNALIFIVQTLLSLVLFVFMLRVLLQLARADFRNPLAQAVVKITNPLILPLRRVLPPIGKIDTASVVAVLIVASIEVFIITTLTREFVPGRDAGASSSCWRSYGRCCRCISTPSCSTQSSP